MILWDSFFFFFLQCELRTIPLLFPLTPHYSTFWIGVSLPTECLLVRAKPYLWIAWAFQMESFTLRGNWKQSMFGSVEIFISSNWYECDDFFMNTCSDNWYEGQEDIKILRLHAKGSAIRRWQMRYQEWAMSGKKATGYLKFSVHCCSLYLGSCFARILGLLIFDLTRDLRKSLSLGKFIR